MEPLGTDPEQHTHTKIHKHTQTRFIERMCSPPPVGRSPAAWSHTLQWEMRFLCRSETDVPPEVSHNTASPPMTLKHTHTFRNICWSGSISFAHFYRIFLQLCDIIVYCLHVTRVWVQSSFSPCWALIRGRTFWSTSKDFLWYSAWTSINYTDRERERLLSGCVFMSRDLWIWAVCFRNLTVWK